jgi:hypothetical protein
VVTGMPIIWGTQKWQIGTAICIIFIFGYGTYAVILDIIVGHPIWWYNMALPLFALTLLGLLLLVRQGWTTLRNIATYGFNPSATNHPEEEYPEEIHDYPEDSQDQDEYFPEDDF